MGSLRRKRFSEEEKVKILLQEYASLRSEILIRTSNLYQLLAFCCALFTWIMAHHRSDYFWVALFSVLLVFLFFFRLISRDIDKAAKRLRELEQDINLRAGETLLVWETRWGGAVAGYWGHGTPLPRTDTLNPFSPPPPCNTDRRSFIITPLNDLES